jgi:predicted GH43/DUF377 family glycosyl hydrolase
MLLKKSSLVVMVATTLLLPLAFAQDGGPVSVSLLPGTAEPVLFGGMQPGVDDQLAGEVSIVVHDDLFHAFYITRIDNAHPINISYATSPDGILWTPYENNPIFTGDGTGFDSAGVRGPLVSVENDGTWLMYYNGIPSLSQTADAIGTGKATASEPIGPWERQDAPIFSRSDNGRAWDGDVMFMDDILKTDEGYTLYYTARGGTGERHMGMATSEDGESWARHNDPSTDQIAFRESDPVFRAGEPDTWEESVGLADIWQSDYGYEMLYTGSGIGYAFSEDGINWTRYAGNPLLPPVETGSIFSPDVIEIDDIFYVYYSVVEVDPQGQVSGWIELATLEVQWE